MKNQTPTAKTFALSRTARAAAVRLGFNHDDLAECFLHPKKVYPSKQRPGQWRAVNRDVCMVGVFSGDTFKVITVIRNGSEAPKAVA